MPVAREVFAGAWATRPNQLDEAPRSDVSVTSHQLLDLRVPDAKLDRGWLAHNIRVGIQYIESWLRGTGAAAIFNLMEDAATAEISRSQVWQWLQNDVDLAEGLKITSELVEQIVDEETRQDRRAPSAAA